jgi:alkylhydroperoxidase family enzyme
MDTLVTALVRRGGALWRALAGRAGAFPTPGGARVLPAYAALARHRLSDPDLDPRVRLLVTQLAAERSRCRWCIERGRHLWREAQLPTEALRALARYETSALFSNRERAALRFAEAVTRYTDEMPLEPLTSARQIFTEAEIAAITGAVAAVHFYNPITGTLGIEVTPWGAPIGSSIRSFWL